jgi:hypothetical protein
LTDRDYQRGTLEQGVPPSLTGNVPCSYIKCPTHFHTSRSDIPNKSLSDSAGSVLARIDSFGIALALKIASDSLSIRKERTMTLRQIALLAVILFITLAGWTLAQQQETASPNPIRIGVYDSRAVAIAYAGSPMHERILKAKMAERDKAKTDGDEERVKELETWGQERQQRMHHQGFGSAPVTEMLAHIKDQLPRIAADAGVDVIVSKWQLDYIHPEITPVDITLKIVAPFEPKPKALKWIEQLRGKEPLSYEEIESHGHDH